MKRPLKEVAIASILLCSSLTFPARAQESFVDTLHDTVTVYSNYMLPPWAPPYDNISLVHYYYLPDCGMYYDVRTGLFWYPEGGIWVSSLILPPLCPEFDLFTAFVVLIDRHMFRPWDRDWYYHRNYPPHFYNRYPDIVHRHHLFRHLPPDREDIPRAFNENSNRVTFMHRTIVPGRSPGADQGRGTPTPPQPRPAPSPQPAPLPTPQPTPHPVPTYDRQVHEVPMRSIAPSMPPETRKYNYGSGYRGAPSGTSSSGRTAPARTPQTKPQSQPRAQSPGRKSAE